MKFPQPFGARLLYGLILVLGIIWIKVSAVPANTLKNESIPSPQTGFSAPDFTLKTLEGKSITLSDLRGKAVLVNIWASWCPPCRAEMPDIQKAYQTYQSKGFIVLAVDSTFQDKLPDAAAFVEELQLSFPILVDDRGLVTKLYRVQSLPSSFFIGPDGIIKEVVIGGPMADALLISRIENLIKDIP